MIWSADGVVATKPVFGTADGGKAPTSALVPQALDLSAASTPRLTDGEPVQVEADNTKPSDGAGVGSVAGAAGSVREKGSVRAIAGGGLLPYDVDGDDGDSALALDQRSVSLHRAGPGGQGRSPFLGTRGPSCCSNRGGVQSRGAGRSRTGSVRGATMGI